MWRLLRRRGWSRQIPTRRAYERDEKAVMTWRSEVWPQVKPQPSTAKQ
ncbi:winged helix-turn-helix domain-containing protein [Streptomyces sp. NPDC057579]